METVHEGWLKKSSAEKKLFRNQKWDQRWFVLKQSGHIPDQYVIEYYTDSTYKKLKGKIDLDQCKQIDVTEDSNKPDEHLFTIRTTKRVYYLLSSKRLDLNKWIQCLCTVCGFKAVQRTDNHLNESTSIKTNNEASCKNNSLTITSYANQSSLLNASHTDQNLLVNKNQNDSSFTLNIKKHRLWNNNIPKTNNHSLLNLNSKTSTPSSSLSLPTKKINLKSAYIPISECHTGQSIFKTDLDNGIKTKYTESNKENEKESLLNTSCLSSFTNTGINYDVPKQINTYKKSKIEDLLDIVPSPPSFEEVEEESLYANAKSLPNNINNSSLNNYCNNINLVNTSLSKDAENVENNNLKQYYNNLESIHLLSPPPRPPKPEILSSKKKSSSLILLNDLDNVPLICTNSPDLMYSIPKSQVELQLEKQANIIKINKTSCNDLDKIVPLMPNNDFGQLRPYTNAPPGIIGKNIFTIYDYDKPNLPVTSANELFTSFKEKSNNLKKDNLISTSLNTSLEMQFPFSISKELNSNLVTGKSSALQISDVFGPPLVNRQLKPRKSESNLTEKSLLYNSQDQFNDKISPNQNSTIPRPISIPPRVSSRGRQFTKKDVTKTDKSVYDEIVKTPKNKPNCNYTEIQYLDLDLECDNLSVNSSVNDGSLNLNFKEIDSLNANNLLNSGSLYLKSPSTNSNFSFNNQSSNLLNNANTVYKTVDFVKTKAFNELRDGLNRKTHN